VCVEHRIFFVLDRLYWRLLFDGATFPEPRIDEATKPWLIQVDGLSKNFRRTGGMRIGWSIAPSDISRAMINLQSHYTAGPAGPEQFAALSALTRPYAFELLDDLARKRDLLQQEAAGMPHVEVWPSPATFYSFWEVGACLGRQTPQGQRIESSDELVAYLVHEAGVVAASGTGFMQDGFLRLSFATSEEDIVQGMAAAREALGRLR
jgi:aspartate aminotransferase